MADQDPKTPTPRTRKAAEPRAELVVKLGDGEVRFEAGLGAVEQRFDGVMDRLFAAWQPAGAARRTTHPAVAMRLVAGGDDPAFTLDLHEVAECYSVNAADELSLRVMPRGEKARQRNADALMLLLYGKLTLQGKSQVTAPALLRSARQSGLALDRASRLLDRRAKYVFAEGRRRGKRYGLTPEGIEYCEKLLASLRSG